MNRCFYYICNSGGGGGGGAQSVQLTVFCHEVVGLILAMAAVFSTSWVGFSII